MCDPYLIALIAPEYSQNTIAPEYRTTEGLGKAAESLALV